MLNKTKAAHHRDELLLFYGDIFSWSQPISINLAIWYLLEDLKSLLNLEYLSIATIMMAIWLLKFLPENQITMCGQLLLRF